MKSVLWALLPQHTLPPVPPLRIFNWRLARVVYYALAFGLVYAIAIGAQALAIGAAVFVSLLLLRLVGLL